jgi:4-diphosphocytidyl-2-C-methyl-D-erythritol kinase
LRSRAALTATSRAQSTKLVLIKPQEGLPTPTVFKALNLATRSTADPLALLAALAASGCSDAVCVNDLEPPAFTVMPALAALKARLQATGRYEAVFMSGSGSTVVCVGDDDAPAWAPQEGLFVARSVRLMTRKAGEWYAAPPARP